MPGLVVTAPGDTTPAIWRGKGSNMPSTLGKAVKRYNMVAYLPEEPTVEPEQDTHGEWVLHEDYADLEEKYMDLYYKHCLLMTAYADKKASEQTFD